MLKPEGSESKLKLWQRLGAPPAFCLLVVLVLTTMASAQADFTLSAATLSPQAIVPGGTSSTSITIGLVNGFTGTVNLGCTVTPVTPTQAVTDAPVCTVSPSSVTPPATATATITSQRATTTVGYDVTITGTGPATTHTTSLGLTVLAVTPQFTIAIQTAMSPNSVPAGNASQGVISVNPVNGYSTPVGGGITLYCSSITPLVTIPPVCSFAYSNGKNLQLVDSPQSVTLTIKTAGTTVIGAAPHSRSFYALWLSIPVLGLVGVGAAVGGKRSGKAWGVFSIFLVCGCLLLFPACVNQLSNGTVGTPNGITPANTYTFTVVGVDSDGVVSSNTGTSTGPVMTLTVTAPPKT